VAQGKGPQRRRLDGRGADGVDGRLWRHSDTHGSVVTCAGRRRRGEWQCNGVCAAAGSTVKAAAWQPYRRRVERGRAATVARRSETRGFEHRRSERHSSAVTYVGSGEGESGNSQWKSGDRRRGVLEHARLGAGCVFGPAVGTGGRSTFYGTCAHVAALPQLTMPAGDRAPTCGPKRGKQRPTGGTPWRNYFRIKNTPVRK
jgi:hypothetical protein